MWRGIGAALSTGRGYELVERNHRTRYGELDLILRKDNTLVFVEVKLRRGSGYEQAYPYPPNTK